jgi:hypothetical protein
VAIDRAMDHVSQKASTRDPDGTVLEIYHLLADARERFRQAGDRDETVEP